MAQGRFVSYLRVSTVRQGRSGLGIEAQRKAVENYLNGGRWTLIQEFVEVESGRRADRPELAKALMLCRAYRAPLVVAKVDRLTRSHSFLAKVQESGVNVHFADLPATEGAIGSFLLQSMVSVAELEAKFISSRTKAALAAVDRKKKKLGGVRRGQICTKETAAVARAGRTLRAKRRSADLAPLLDRIDPDNAMSLRALARALNEEGVPTATGRGEWTAAGVARLQAHLRAGA